MYSIASTARAAFHDQHLSENRSAIATAAMCAKCMLQFALSTTASPTNCRSGTPSPSNQLVPALTLVFRRDQRTIGFALPTTSLMYQPFKDFPEPPVKRASHPSAVTCCGVSGSSQYMPKIIVAWPQLAMSSCRNATPVRHLQYVTSMDA